MLAQEAADWHHRGIVDAALAKQLGKRFDRHGAFLAVLVKWLGLLAIFLLGLAVLTGIGLLLKSAALGGVMLGAFAVGLWFAGVKMATDPAQRHAVTGAALVTIGLSAAFGALALLVEGFTDRSADRTIPTLLLFTSILSAGTAYGYRLRWPLLLALLCFFHGLGAWHQYGGRGYYIANIPDPRTMAAVAAACTALGLWHQHAEDGRLVRYCGFGRLYVIFGLLYFNCSLWFLSLPLHGDKLVWTLVFSAACIAEIILGARLKDGKLTGFGIVFLGIDVYTQFFEHFWDRLSVGSFFLAAGVIGMLLGYVFERQGRVAAERADGAAA